MEKYFDHVYERWQGTHFEMLLVLECYHIIHLFNAIYVFWKKNGIFFSLFCIEKDTRVWSITANIFFFSTFYLPNKQRWFYVSNVPDWKIEEILIRKTFKQKLVSPWHLVISCRQFDIRIVQCIREQWKSASKNFKVPFFCSAFNDSSLVNKNSLIFILNKNLSTIFSKVHQILFIGYQKRKKNE